MKKIGIVLLALMLPLLMSAQKNLKYISAPADNCYISFSGGIQGLINESNLRSLKNKQNGFFTGGGNLSLGKFFNPWSAIQLTILGGQSALNSYYQLDDAGDISYDATSPTAYTQLYANASIDLMYDITSIIGGYKSDRLLSYYIYFGPGMTMSEVYDISGDGDQNFTPIFNATAGMMGSIRLSNSFYFNIDLRGWVTPSIFGDYSSNYTEGTLALMGGFTYVIGGKKFVPYLSQSDSERMIEDANKSISDCQSALADANRNLLEAQKRDSLTRAEMEKVRADAQAAIDEAMRQKQQQPKGTNIVTVTKTDTIVKTVVKEKILLSAGPMAIFFEENMSAIDDRGLVNIQLAADAMKTTPKRKYKLVGYTDINRSEVSVSSNKSLSIKRAKKVYDELVRLGVSPKQLSYTGMGPQENMFGTNELNRVVLIEAIPEASDK